ncbi:hypothetical protein IP88_00180 [alpha proteobacterium AAP81b]|nr:hypothetical protein IP88_00180 [alpha proteobacterium AAP81b]
MPISLHAAFVPSARQIIGSCLGVLAKAEAHAAETGCGDAALIGACLAADMAPVPFQVRSVAAHSAGAVAGVRAGRFSPSFGEMPTDFAGLKAALVEADTALAATDEAELETFIGKPMIFALGTMELPFTGDQFLLSFSQPNFYFHAATLYDILRNQGAKLGKRDFLGAMRMAV